MKRSGRTCLCIFLAMCSCTSKHDTDRPDTVAAALEALGDLCPATGDCQLEPALIDLAQLCDTPHQATDARLLDSAEELLRARLDTETVPDALIHVLFEDLALIAVPDDASASRLMPWDVLRGKRAGCLGLSVLATVLARRCGLRIHTVLAPGHAFVRHAGDPPRNIELLRGGACRDDGFYRDHFGVDDKADVYMESLTDRQLVGAVIYNLANDRNAGGKLSDALRLYAAATSMIPGLAEAHGNYGVALLDAGRPADALTQFELVVSASPGAEGGYLNLGATLERLGRHREARDAYARGAASCPQSAALQRALERIVSEDDRSSR